MNQTREPGGAHDTPNLADLSARFRAPLLSYFRKRISNTDEASDLVQEVFLRLSQHRQLGEVENPDAYIFQIAANLMRDRARREATHRGTLSEMANRTENSVEEISPERVLIAKDEIERLHRALLELPERTRLIFMLHRFEGIKYSEIATRMAISVSGVEKHMIDALRHIRTRLAPGRRG